MNMKDMIQRMTDIENNKTQLNESAIAECGMTEMPAIAAPTNPGTPVSMNVSLNASGKEHVDDLINMMKNAGMGAAEPVSSKMLSPRMDMERLSAMMGEPDIDMGPEMEELEDEIEVEGGGIDMDCPECRGSGKVDGETCDHCGGSGEHSGEVESADGGFGDATTEPDETYQDTEYMTKDLSGGLNREKKSYKVVAGGDNPMAYKMEVEAIKTALLKALTEKKAKPDFLDVDKDGDKKEPMKKALKDKGGAAKKGQVPPQFAKKK